jgi:hypothetical protein
MKYACIDKTLGLIRFRCFFLEKLMIKSTTDAYDKHNFEKRDEKRSERRDVLYDGANLSYKD